jgi:hypothetical protein
MSIRPEIRLRLPNSPGSLADVTGVLAAEHVNILALMLDRGGELRLVVDNHVRAVSILQEHHYQVSQGSALAVDVPQAHGSLAPVLALVRDGGVNVEYAYSGSASQGSALVVLGVDDPLRAAGKTGL